MTTNTNLDKSGLGKKLKNYRRQRNFSQESLAQASGISVRTIQRLEEGAPGSPYTLDKLALALGIDVSLLTEEKTVDTDHSTNKEKLNLVNLSVLSVILIPLANIILPFFILLKNKENAELNDNGRKIINFQIIWTLATLGVIIIIPLLLLLIKPFQGSSVPLSIPAYYLCVAVNVFFTLRSSIAINNQQPFLNHMPKIL